MKYIALAIKNGKLYKKSLPQVLATCSTRTHACIQDSEQDANLWLYSHHIDHHIIQY
jgi:hypothetical protein